VIAPILALSLLPKVDASAEIGHFVGLGRLRGTIRLAIDVEVVRGETFAISIFTEAQSFVRRNEGTESPVRISPQQMWYPVGARLRWDRPGGESWGFFAFHQSNHDIDTDDAQLNQETVSFEVYGAEYLWPHLRLMGGLYYDRGTRLSGRPQTLPFDYYVAGLGVRGELPLGPRWYLAGALNPVFHRNGDHAIPYLNLPGNVDVGLRFSDGPEAGGGQLRVFVRGQRVEDYQHLGDRPEHLLLLGVGLDSFAW
jgi:hypothetical protein